MIAHRCHLHNDGTPACHPIDVVCVLAIWCNGVQVRCPRWTKSLFNNAAISIRASKPYHRVKPYINGTDGNLR